MFKLLRIFSVLAISLSLPTYAQQSGDWSHESEAGVLVSGGNSKTQTYNAKQGSAYKWSLNEVSSTAHYLYGESNQVKSANNWSAGLRYDRYISTPWSFFLGNLWEGDQFKGYDYRSNIDVGSKYFFIQNAKNEYVFGELGYRYTFEDKVDGVLPASQSNHSLRSYVEGAYAFNDAVSGKLWIEYLHDLSDADNYAINFEPSVSVMMTQIFSLKMSYLGQFDNQPAKAGNKDYDWVYSTSLVAKF